VIFKAEIEYLEKLLSKFEKDYNNKVRIYLEN